MWRYRDLVGLLVHRDFVSKYKQTVLGPLWFIIQPLLMTAVFTVIFAKVAQIPTDGMPPMLFYLCGLLGWNYFATTFQATSGALTANAAIFGKVYFPRLVVPLASAISGFIAFGIQLATFVLFWCYFKWFTVAGSGLHLGWGILWFPVLMLQIALLSLGVGLWIASLTAKYRDFTFVVSLIIQLWMYATPVIYPLSRIPDQWRWLAVVNPMTMPTEAIRRILLGQGLVEPIYVAVASFTTLILLVSGIAVFGKVEKTFVDTA